MELRTSVTVCVCVCVCRAETLEIIAIDFLPSSRGNLTRWGIWLEDDEPVLSFFSVRPKMQKATVFTLDILAD